MNLVDMLNREAISKINKVDLLIILEGENPNIKVKSASNGAIVLDNGVIIKCVKEYYHNDKKISSSTGCYNIQNELNLEYVQINDCRGCHIECLKRNNRGLLKRILK